MGTHSGSRSVKPISKQFFEFAETVKHCASPCVGVASTGQAWSKLFWIVRSAVHGSWQMTRATHAPKRYMGFAGKGWKPRAVWTKVLQTKLNPIISSWLKWLGNLFAEVSKIFHSIDSTLGTCTSCMRHIRIRMPPSRSRANFQIWKHRLHRLQGAGLKKMYDTPIHIQFTASLHHKKTKALIYCFKNTLFEHAVWRVRSYFQIRSVLRRSWQTKQRDKRCMSIKIDGKNFWRKRFKMRDSDWKHVKE